MSEDVKVEESVEPEIDYSGVFEPSYTLTIDLKEPISYGNYKQSYLRYSIADPEIVEFDGNSITFIDTPGSGIRHGVPADNVAHWQVEYHHVPPLKGQQAPYLYRQYRVPLGMRDSYWLGCYELKDGKCVAMLEANGEISYMSDPK